MDSIPLMFKKVKDFLSYYFIGLFKRLDEHHVFLAGSGLAFSLIICVLPLILIVFSILGILLETSPIKHQINTFIDTIIPYQESAEYFKEIICSRINEFQIFKTISGSLGILGLLFAASGLFSSMRTVLNDIFKADVEVHMVVGKLRDFAMIILVIFFFLFSITIFPLLDILVSLLDQLNLKIFLNLGVLIRTLISIAVSLISFFVIFLMIFTLYYFIPYGKLDKKTVALSALWTTILWQIAKELFGYYIAHSLTLTRVYGAYLFFVAIVLWIYYSAIVFIVGAEIGQLYRERKGPNKKIEPN